MKSTEVRQKICVDVSTGQELHRVEDSLGLVIVTQHGEKRVLSFDSNLQQSCVLMSRPHFLPHEYAQIMLLGLLFVDAKNITLLGLGGGGLAHCLCHFFPQCKIKIAELRQSVIDIAYDWFELPKTENLQIVCSDAHEFVRTHEALSADLIMSDLYLAAGMSEVQTQIAFINSTFQSLSSPGCLVINFHKQPEADSLLMQEIHKLFDLVYVCEVFKGNRVLFCCKAIAALRRDELKNKAKLLTQLVEMPLTYYAKQLHIITAN